VDAERLNLRFDCAVFVREASLDDVFDDMRQLVPRQWGMIERYDLEVSELPQNIASHSMKGVFRGH